MSQLENFLQSVSVSVEHSLIIISGYARILALDGGKELCMRDGSGYGSEECLRRSEILLSEPNLCLTPLLELRQYFTMQLILWAPEFNQSLLIDKESGISISIAIPTQFGVIFSLHCSCTLLLREPLPLLFNRGTDMRAGRANPPPCSRIHD